MRHLVTALLFFLLNASTCNARLFSPVENGENEHRRAQKSSTKKYSPLTDGPFKVKLNLLSPDDLDGYKTCKDMRKAIKESAKHFANQIIVANVKKGKLVDTTKGGPIAIADVGEGTFAVAKASSTQVTETDFATNNQEVGVDEADVVKSDGTFIYTAYGDVLVVLDTSGKEVYRVQMPAINHTAYDPLKENVIPRASSTALVASDQVVSPYYAARRRPKIVALLLDIASGRLVVIVTGYGSVVPYYYANTGTKVFRNYGSTQLRVYDTKRLTGRGKKLKFLGCKDLTGDYKAARSIGKYAHIVTSSTMSSYNYITNPLKRIRQDFWNLDDKQYLAAATKIAKKLISQYAKQIMKELQLKGKGCDDIMRISAMQGLSSPGSAVLNGTYTRELLKSFVEISSFDMSGKFKKKMIKTSTAGMFLPTPSMQVYASTSMLVVAGQGSYFHQDTSIYEQETYLVGFGLNRASSTPTALGAVPGYLLNTFSLDHFGDHIRCATSTRAQTKTVWSTNADGKRVATRETIREANNQLFVLSLPAKTTNNKKIVMKQVGLVDGLGEKGEQIFSVRFLDKVAFVVTFQRTDPFYTIDLTDPAKPTVVGELKISGFSNYLHPINDDQSQVLAVGQEADPKTGRATGLQISLFDVSDLKSPKLLSKYLVENDPNARSYSNAQWDHKAFRYLKQSKIAILPVSVYNYNSKNPDDNFDGFWTFNIGTDKIDHSYSFSQVNPKQINNYCWYPAYLQPRTAVFNGNLVTMKSHSIVSHSLNDGKQNWLVNLDQGYKPQTCGRYFLF